MHESESSCRADHHLARSGGAVLVAVLARLVDVEIVVRMFHRRDAQAADDDLGDKPDHQRGLAAAAPSCQAEYLHAVDLDRRSCVRDGLRSNLSPFGAPILPPALMRIWLAS